jgi:hypothetical protein
MAPVREEAQIGGIVGPGSAAIAGQEPGDGQNIRPLLAGGTTVELIVAMAASFGSRRRAVSRHPTTPHSPFKSSELSSATTWAEVRRPLPTPSRLLGL